MSQHSALPDLLDRIARLHLAARRDAALNPAQAAALDYLARANRFSRMPSAVADYLAATRGTVSQTLKSLARKGMIRDHPAPGDGRARRYDLTPEGLAAATRLATLDPDLPPEDAATAETALRRLLTAMIRESGGRSFGLCHTCRHHTRRDGGPYCALLDLPLAPDEADQICIEHEAA